ncbi:hypothetical protein ACWCPD_06085 [Streptomyces sp. NPDC001935]
MEKSDLACRKVWAGFVAVLLAACTGCAASGTQATAPVPAKAPKMTSATRMRLPIESYMFSDGQRDQVVEAKSKSIGLCMRRFGFVYDMPERSHSFRPESLTELRYGITSSSDAASYGYKPEGSDAAPGKPAPAKPEPKGYALALNGGSDRVDRLKGTELPEGGCVGEARRALRDTEKDGGGGDAEISNSINAASWQSSFQDARVRKVFQQWSQCMKLRGYEYADPMEANNDPRWKGGEPATATEKKVAVADTECKKRLNVVGTWHAVDMSYQEKMIADNREKLQPVKRKIDMQLRLAAKILGE